MKIKDLTCDTSVGQKKSVTNSERKIENRLVKLVPGLVLKWVSPGNSGIPDRIVICGGKVWFVELKKPKGGVVSKLQLFRQRQFRKHGVEIVYLWTYEDVELFVNLIRK
jgi:hypothetical protein